MLNIIYILAKQPSYCLLCNMTFGCHCLAVMNVKANVTVSARGNKVKLQFTFKPIYKTLGLFLDSVFYPESLYKST